MKKCFIVLLIALCVIGVMACKQEPAHEHTWDEGVPTPDATCTEDGTMLFTCECGETRTETIPAKGHSYELGWSHDELYHWHAATCGHTELFTDKDVHNWGLEGEITTPATHTQTGVRTYTCLNCLATKEELIPADASAHEYSTEWTKDENFHWHQATCGHNVINDSAAHTFGDVVAVTPATCTAAGAGTQTCTVCGYVKDVVIPALGHNPNENHACTRCGIFVPFVGATGGYVFYDCDFDNDETNDGAGPDGLKSSVCGWRYLEAAPADLRVVGGVPTVDSSLDGYYYASAKICFGYYKPLAEEGWKYVNGTGTYNAANCTGTAVGTGKTNTQMLVEAMGVSYAYDGSSNQIDKYAARMCYTLTHTVDEVTFDDWFLPSIDELRLMYKNLYENKLGNLNSSYHWSSSEEPSYAGREKVYYMNIHYDLYEDRQNSYIVRPIRSFI